MSGDRPAREQPQFFSASTAVMIRVVMVVCRSAEPYVAPETDVIHAPQLSPPIKQAVPIHLPHPMLRARVISGSGSPL
jgi:hypothetical protein